MKSICVFGAASTEVEKVYLDAAYEMGRLMAENGYFLVYGGGGEGVMGRVADGVFESGGEITGVVPDYLDVDGAIFEKCTQLIVTETLRDRKRIMDEKSDAIVAMVGGVGTLEEFMEMLALKQLCRHNKPVVILNTNDYYHHLVKMLEEIIVQKFAKPASADLYYIAETPADAIEYIKNYKPTHTVIKKLRYIKTEEEAK